MCTSERSMSCFPRCFPLNGGKYSADDSSDDHHHTNSPSSPHHGNSGNGNISARSFTFRELASATMDFRKECLVGVGGFGRVYKGFLENTDQVVAVKQLDRNGLQGNNEFIIEVLMLSLLHNSNLVNLIGYCSDGDQRLLVYEFMQLGSLEDQLLDLTPDQTPLSWDARMRIASGTAKGLEFLHEEANPPVIHGDLKSSNVLLDEEFNPKLSDFGLAKLDSGLENGSSPRVMGSYGYCAPEYARTGQITIKSDVYSYGVLLLELITGRRAFDSNLAPNHQNIIAWAKPMLKDPRRSHELADPLLQGNYNTTQLNQVIAISAMCLHEEPMVRPLMTDVVKALGFLSTEPPPPPPEGPESHRNVSSVGRRGTPSPQRSIIREEQIQLCVLLELDNSMQRRRAVAEAIKWGEDSRNKMSQPIHVLT